MENKEFDNMVDSAIEQAAANMELENYKITEEDKKELKEILCESSKNKVLMMCKNDQRKKSIYGRME